MGLAIAAFVPEGIVIVSDGIAEIRNTKNDNGFLQRKQRTMFSFREKYIICVQGNGYLNGLPYAFYIEKIFYYLKNDTFYSTQEFANRFMQMIKNDIKEYGNLLFYIAGIDEIETDGPTPILCLADNKNITIINRGNDGQNVYNYHSIGHNLWVNKLLLPTVFETSDGEKIAFDNVDIDFSKYSIEEAIDFAKSMIKFTSLMDIYAQLSELVGKSLYVGVLTLYENKIKVTANL